MIKYNTLLYLIAFCSIDFVNEAAVHSFLMQKLSLTLTILKFFVDLRKFRWEHNETIN